MNSKKVKYSYIVKNDITIVSIPYKFGRYSFTIYMPSDINSFQFDSKVFDCKLDHGSDVELYMPLFTLEYGSIDNHLNKLVLNMYLINLITWIYLKLV